MLLIENRLVNTADLTCIEFHGDETATLKFRDMEPFAVGPETAAKLRAAYDPDRSEAHQARFRCGEPIPHVMPVLSLDRLVSPAMS